MASEDLKTQLSRLRVMFTNSMTRCRIDLRLPRTVGNASFLKDRFQRAIENLDSSKEKIDICLGEIKNLKNEYGEGTRDDIDIVYDKCRNDMVKALKDLSDLIGESASQPQFKNVSGGLVHRGENKCRQVAAPCKDSLDDSGSDAGDDHSSGSGHRGTIKVQSGCSP